jgi:hypothetical protein
MAGPVSAGYCVAGIAVVNCVLADDDAKRTNQSGLPVLARTQQRHLLGTGFFME